MRRKPKCLTRGIDGRRSGSQLVVYRGRLVPLIFGIILVGAGHRIRFASGSLVFAYSFLPEPVRITILGKQ